jgi:formylglycine-generating enzyme required for sulfatase activity
VAKTSLTRDTAQRYTTRLVERIAASRQLREMAGTPLLLTMMALVLYNKGDLPRDRPQLYEGILDLLLGRWDAVQEKGGQTLAEYIGLPEWDSQRLLPLLDRLSYEAHRTAASADGRGRLARSTVRDTLIGFFQQANLSETAAFAKAGRCIDYIQQRSGLLMPDGNESYVFAHLTLQEHCAGRYVVLGSEDPARLVLEHRADDRWREPIMLGLGLAPPADLDDVLEALWKPHESRRAKPRACWYRDLVLAAEIGEDREWAYLQTLPRIQVAKHQEQLRWGLATLLKDPLSPFPCTERVRIGFLLGRLGNDPRLLDPTTGNSPDRCYWCSLEASIFWYGETPEKLQQICLEFPFHIARYLVTNAEYARFIAAGGYENRQWWTENGWQYRQKQGWTAPRYWHNSQFHNPSQPVVGISWYEATAYCHWLTMQGYTQGWLPLNHEIRLPTSLEWERAARHIDWRPYPWAQDEPTPERANYKATGIGRPSPVGCFPAGAAACGAQDMAGNVWEWLATPDGKSEQREPKKDVISIDRVLLSGATFRRGEYELLCGLRYWNHPLNAIYDQGFRIVLVPCCEHHR